MMTNKPPDRGDRWESLLEIIAQHKTTFEQPFKAQDRPTRDRRERLARRQEAFQQQLETRAQESRAKIENLLQMPTGLAD